MSITVDEGCLNCMLKRNRELVLSLGTEEQAEAFFSEFRKIYEDAPAGVSSPWFSPYLTDLLHKHYGLPIDRYRQEKEESNRFVLERLDTIRQKVTSAPDPVLAGLQFSILGNYLDFAALQGQVSFDKLDTMLEEALEMQLDETAFAITSASCPNICPIFIFSHGEEIVISSVFLGLCIIARADNISLYEASAPKTEQTSLNPTSVTPAIGAKIKPSLKSIFFIFMILF